MSLSDRRREFEAAARAEPLVTPATKFHRLFGVSNSAKVIGGGLQLGVVNLDNVPPNVDGFAFAGTIVFPPADEVYFAAYVKSGATTMMERLTQMKHLGTAAGSPYGPGVAEDEEPAEKPGFAARNNNVVVVLADDGNLYLRNQGFWDALPDDRSGLGPPIPVDRINVALYPPAASAQRSMLAREFVGYLGQFVGREKVHELRPWADAAAPVSEMRRMPAAIPLAELEASVSALGGYYPHGEVARFHAGLNFLQQKHFVILSGLSGTGKTQLALKYARAVHGLGISGADPFLFVCPVRPEWTDPSGLTGYYDVLSNRYQVPPFLEAVLLATAHRESPVFVVLDEMNLARVEYYLSDVLSAVETGEPLQLHASGVNLEGSTGESVPASLPVPPNLFITGTINVDETTNPVSDKVLDRAVVIDMSTVDLDGFFENLEKRYPELKAPRAACAPHLLAVQSLMAQHNLGFGYRVAEEALRYQAFAAEHLKLDAADVTDDLLVQKVLVKLRGGERQRPLLTGLVKALAGMKRSQVVLERLTEDLDEYGSFQASR